MSSAVALAVAGALRPIASRAVQRVCACLSLALTCAATAQAQRLSSAIGVMPVQWSLATAATPSVNRPDLEPLRIGGELLVGSYSGIGGFLLGRYAGLLVVDLVSTPKEDTRDGVAFTTGVIGAWLGTSAGVYGIGSIGNQTGSFGTTAFGAGIGTIAGVFLDRMVFAPRRGDPSANASSIRWKETLLESFLPSIGATIAFNSSRRYK